MPSSFACSIYSATFYLMKMSDLLNVNFVNDPSNVVMYFKDTSKRVNHD
ncbi:hypothetical protein N7499_013237 [Penicillium canescens]|uniref:Uncharacterized protein n=1 Tax=Penicillium canescens TaxID=5083 RepID=A0AAD6N5C4_PENCN|nr:uncharacterized protein N7446_000111 [Penicillium canescens]KAJ6011790.1 hypothetical protein N7522_002145 [Penicillium canescens]KAJ6030822.1 hypothetical protein N7460_011088 [Penicillium canescens]KAJ6059460.1 hypothetical protein N7444_003099 [Penicillium canescens]KAJ6064557.1 hypothetical protein N7499_013237 [Penicillium canescens]KAJ6077175.1 hypothetical protein N7446_000111 [Penicillium canescens]